MIYQSWLKKECPINEGWSIDAVELLNNHPDNIDANSHCLIIDFHPSSIDRIAFIEIDKIHIYTYGNKETKQVYWSPMMWEIINVFYEEDYENLTVEEKNKIISEFKISPDRGKHIEFLYLQGGWNWGRNGSTNAAFISDEARKYFRQFF